VDEEVKQLIEQFPERDNSDDPFSELEESTEINIYDRLIMSLSGGDIIKGLEIMKKVTIIEALEWLLTRMNDE